MQVFRSKFGQGLAIVVWFVLGLALWQTLAELGFWALIQSLPAALLFSQLAWVFFFNPRVSFDDESVTFVNILRSHRIPFSAINRVDTRWALEVYTEGRKYVAWGAPAPGRHTALFATKDQGDHLPESSYLLGTVRPGDLVNTDSGAAAAYLRAKLEGVEFNGARVESRWHKTSLLITISMLLLTLVAA
jgi:hypothetical protein